MSVFDVGAYQSDINPHLHAAEITYIFSSNVVCLMTDLFIAQNLMLIKISSFCMIYFIHWNDISEKRFLTSCNMRKFASVDLICGVMEMAASINLFLFLLNKNVVIVKNK